MIVTTCGMLLAASAVAHQSENAPCCEPQGDRMAARVTGAVERGRAFTRTTPAGWIVRLVPGPDGWLLQVSGVGREQEDLARMTPAWHFVPNAREIAGWHFRNADNTGPNDGSVNAGQLLREFIFSPAVGRDGEYGGSATTPEDVARVQAFGRGWLRIESFRLTPARRGERAALEAMTFTACLTWPANLPPIHAAGRRAEASPPVRPGGAASSSAGRVMYGGATQKAPAKPA